MLINHLVLYEFVTSKIRNDEYCSSLVLRNNLTGSFNPSIRRTTMSEHGHMSSNQVHGLVQQRLAQGKPVGRLINNLQSRGHSTSSYQTRRTTSDVAAHVRWKASQGQSAPQETRELSRRGARAAVPASSASPHSSLSNTQIRRLIARRLAQGKRVGRLLNTLRSRGVGVSEYQSRRTTKDLKAHVRWCDAHGVQAAEEKAELSSRKPWWKIW